MKSKISFTVFGVRVVGVTLTNIKENQVGAGPRGLGNCCYGRLLLKWERE